jgi:hypothetical protein
MIAFFADENAGQVIFHVARPLRDKVHEWELAQDWEVFDEKLRTGSFHGKFHFPEDMIRVIQEQRDQLDRPYPYYGCGGGPSCSTDQFEVWPTKIILRINHECTGREFTHESTQPAEPFDCERKFVIGGTAYKRLSALDNGRYLNPDGCVFLFAGTGLGLVSKVKARPEAPWVDLTGYENW